MTNYVSIVSAMPGHSVLVVGDVMLDHTIYGIVRRRSPEANIPILERERDVYSPGGCGNVAANVAALGGIVYLCSVIGKDQNALYLQQKIKECGIEPLFIVDNKRKTTLKERGIATSVDERILKELNWPESENQHIFRNDTEDTEPISSKVEKSAMLKVKKIIADVDGVIVSDYDKGFVTPRLCQYVISLAKKQGKFVAVDPKAEFSKYRNATLLKPNLSEMARHNGYRRMPEHIAARSILQNERIDALLLTKGSEGMVLYDAKGFVQISAIKDNKQVQDVTGAGDTVTSAFTSAVLSGASMRESAVISNYAASVVVGRSGTQTLTTRELLAELKKGCKIVDNSWENW